MTSKECALPTQSLAQPKKRKIFVSVFFPSLTLVTNDKRGLHWLESQWFSLAMCSFQFWSSRRDRKYYKRVYSFPSLTLVTNDKRVLRWLESRKLPSRIFQLSPALPFKYSANTNTIKVQKQIRCIQCKYTYGNKYKYEFKLSIGIFSYFEGWQLKQGRYWWFLKRNNHHLIENDTEEPVQFVSSFEPFLQLYRASFRFTTFCIALPFQISLYPLCKMRDPFLQCCSF